MKSKQVMVLMYSTILLKSKQAMVLSYKTIFQRVSKQENKSIFYKTGLMKIPSFKQAYRSEVFRTCTVMLGYHSCILDLPGQQT